MKKNAIVLFFAMTVGTAVVLTTGCSKDDTTAPVVTLTGASDITLSLNSGTWTDLGATATDEEDGTTTVTSDASSTNPNVNQVGVYTISYTSTDAAGNVGSAVRTITVKNDAENFAGIYTITDVTVPGSPYVFTDTVTVDQTLNNRIHFARFNDYANNSGIYATKLANGNLEIPSQVGANIGTGTNPCDVADHTFQSTSYSGTDASFTMFYSDLNNCNSASVVFETNWVKQ